MLATNATTQAAPQADAAKNLANLPPHAAIERQARMLCQRFALPSEVARTVAGLAFAAEVRV
jgi:hypothetical protein